MAIVLPFAMTGISARPVGSLGKILHQFGEHTDEATLNPLLQRMSPFMARSRHEAMSALRLLSGEKRTRCARFEDFRF